VLEGQRRDVRRIRQGVEHLDYVRAVQPEHGVHTVGQQARHDSLAGRQSPGTSLDLLGRLHHSPSARPPGVPDAPAPRS
jgi:hypothetical protein